MSKESIIVLTCHCHELLNFIVMMVDRPGMHSTQSRVPSAVATSEYQIMHNYQASVPFKLEFWELLNDSKCFIQSYNYRS
jgi:hypothetical protein